MEQYQYLIDMSMEFQKVVVDALATNYGRHKIFKDHPSLRLVTNAVNRSEAMSTMFAKDGHTYDFAYEAKFAEDGASDLDVDEEGQADFAEDDDEEMDDDEEDQGEAGTSPDQSVGISVRQYLDRTAIDDLLPNTADVAKPQRGKTLNWLRRVYRDSRGYEIGTVNLTLLASIMKEQARKWEDIALGYVADVIVLTHTFINDLLYELCPTRRVRESILSLLMDQLCTKYKAAIEHVVFLLAVDLDGTPSTLNHYFNDNLQKWYVSTALLSLPYPLIRFAAGKRGCKSASNQRPLATLSMERLFAPVIFSNMSTWATKSIPSWTSMMSWSLITRLPESGLLIICVSRLEITFSSPGLIPHLRCSPQRLYLS